MSLLLTTADSKLFIGSAKAFGNADFVEGDFTDQSAAWVEINGLTNLGSAGDTSGLATSDQIGRSRTRKGKTVRNAGSMQVVADIDPADAGQLALIAAEKSKQTFAFKLEFPDAPEGGTPSTRLFVALVMSVSEQWDEASSVMKLNTTLEIDSNIVRVAAAPAAP